MQDWLSARVQASPHAVALVCGDNQWTYRELNASVAAYVARLIHCGIERGDRVGVLLPNDFEYVCLIHAIARIGAVIVPLNTRLTQTELAWQIEKTGCKRVICADDT